MHPTSLPTSAADDAVKQREPPAKHHNATTPRAPRPAIEALLDRRRPAALPALSPQPTPGNSTSADIVRPKRDGSTRPISSPEPVLMDVHRWVLANVLVAAPLH